MGDATDAEPDAEPEMDAELRVDGNAAAGLLDQLFAFEITSAMATCDGCGRETAVGALDVYDLEMGAVLRCPACDGVMLRATRIRRVWRLEMRGVRVLRVGPGGQ
jgi:uncharacterized protein DUF6510